MNRDRMLATLRDRSIAWDVVVIGGGATGLGCAVDAAARGYRTLLVEQGDFAAGTSSRSTKLIHGGVRYLRRGDVALVREGLAERARLLANAPHIVHPLRFLLPVAGVLERAWYGTGLTLYDALAGGKKLGRARYLNSAATEAALPALTPGTFHGAMEFGDAQFDDARLAIALARTAAGAGATVLNYVRVTGFRKTAGVIRGVEMVDGESGETFDVPARVVVNATGVFTDRVRALDDASATPLVRASRGVHLVLDRALFPGDHGLLFPHTDDKRVLFMIPWRSVVLLGTTDTPTDEVTLSPAPAPAEIDYLLAHAARFLARAPSAGDIRSVFAGLRPLAAGRKSVFGSTAAMSREHHLTVSPSLLVTITGGKWTTYRRMAAETIDQAAHVGELRAAASPTAALRLHGWRRDGVPSVWAEYGSDAESVRAIAAEDGSALSGQTRWAARHEMARTVEDVLSRRTRLLIENARAAVDAAPAVAAILALELGRDDAWVADETRRFTAIAASYLPT